jgi:hypothetical protein
MKHQSKHTLVSHIHRCIFPALLLAGALSAKAQIGSGWTSMSIGGFIDYEVADKHFQHDISSFSLPSMYYTKGTSSETFGLKTSDSNRVEHDTNSHFNTGRRQFEGYLQVYPGISMQSVVQDFGGGSGGPICMIKCYSRNNGSLVVTRDTSVNLITNCFSAGKIRVNIIHDAGQHLITVYINGSKKWSGADAGTSYTGSYNFKYGLYGSFNAATHTVWTNVKMWH